MNTALACLFISINYSRGECNLRGEEEEKKKKKEGPGEKKLELKSGSDNSAAFA